MIHRASCSTSHRVKGRGVESVRKKVCAQALLRLRKTRGWKLGCLTGPIKRSWHALVMIRSFLIGMDQV